MNTKFFKFQSIFSLCNSVLSLCALCVKIFVFNIFGTTLFFLLLYALPISLFSQTTYYTSGVPGNWNNSATWSTSCSGAGGAGVPTSVDDVVICNGTVTMNDDGASCNSITLSGGTMSWSNKRTTTTGTFILQGGTITGSQTGILNVTGSMTATSGTTGIGRCDLTVSGTATIDNGAFVNITSSLGIKNFGNLILSGTFNNVANAAITISGNLQNDGSYTVGSGQVTFSGASDNTITGTQSTAFTSINIDKGTSNSSDLDVQSNITLTDGGLALTNGTLKLSNSSISIIPFTISTTIPSTAGIWCNGATVNAGNINWTVEGLLRISAGAINLGNTSNNNFIANGGTTQLTVEGGTLNVAGNITKQGVGDYITFNMSNGTIVVSAIGSSTAGVSPFQMDEASGSFTMSNGTIIIRSAGNGNLGFTGSAGTSNITGGTLQIGDASTPASQTILINTAYSIANLSVNSTNATARLSANLTIVQSINISSGTLDANNLTINFGNSWTNTSVFTPGTGTVILNGTGTQTITKSGGETFNNLTVSKSTGTVSLANNVQVNGTLNMTQGNIDCGSGTLTLGVSTVSTGTLTYTAGTIIGNFKRWINSTGVGILFPIGTSSYYRPSLITFTNLGGGTLTASFSTNPPGSSGLPYTDDDGITLVQNPYTEGYWSMTAGDGLSSTNYALECNGNGFTSYSMGASTRLMYRTSDVNPWVMNGTHTAASGYTAKRNALNGLSAQFAFGKPACSAFATSSITTLTADPICANQLDVDYSVDASSPSNTYVWSLPSGGGAIDPPGTGASITVDWGGTGGQYTVRVTETNDCGDNNTPVDLSITIHPIATSAITGSTSVAINETNIPYSVTNTTGYSYSWTLPSGGGAIDAPATGNAITIDWGATPGTYSVRVDATRSCGAPDFQTLSVTVRGPIISTGTGGNWTIGGTWVGGVAPTSTDYVEIAGGATVDINQSSAACYKLTIKGNANWSQARTLTVGNGGVVITTGNITGTGNGTLISTGGLTGTANSPVSSSSVNIILQTTAGQSITSDGSLNKLQIDATTTNTGTLTISNGGTLSGSSTLTQASSSTLSMNGSTFTLTSLNASATGNTVVYGGNADQAVRSSTYYNVSFSGLGTKTLSGNITVTGNLTISGVTLDVSTNNYSTTLSGNWLNTGTFTPRGGTVSFNGSSTQTITKAGGETFNNLVFSGAGTKQLANDVTINFDFTNSSAFDAGINDININGNWDNSGSFSATNDITFSNNTTISGPSSTTFNNVIITGTLNGHATNFNVTGTWTNNGTFNNNSGKVTFSGTTSFSGASTNSFANVDITGTLTAPTGNMNLSRNFNNSGTFNHNSGTLTFNGTLAQTIQGNNTFNNLTIDNSSGGGVAVTSGSQNLINTLTLTDGTFNTNNDFTLVSTSSATARIAEITLGGITGDITMQRYVPVGNASWRQLSTAVSGRTLNDWFDDFNMCGFTGTSSCGAGFVSVKNYDESVAGGKEIGWVNATNLTDAITVGKGYICYSGVGSPFNMDVKGATNTGNIGLPVTWNNSGSPADDGWNLVANPYPCEIDWSDNPAWTKSGLTGTIYIWNPASQNYEWWFGPNPGEKSTNGSPYIPSSQSFWVQANASPSLTVTEAAKTASNPAFFKISGDGIYNNQQSLNLLNLKIESSNTFSDETFIRFENGGNTYFNSDEDVYKLFSSSDVPHIVSAIDDSVKAALNTLSELSSDITIPIHAGGKATQKVISGTDTFYLCNKVFTISANQLDAISTSVCIILEDTKTGNFVNLRDTSYSFTVTDTSYAPISPRFVPALTSTPRFLLHIGSSIEKKSSNASCHGYNDGFAIAKGKGTGPWNYLWKDESNSVVQVSTSLSTEDTLKNLGAGIYSVEVTGNNGYCGLLADTIVINEPLATISVITDFAGASCFGASDGEITLFVSGDFPPFNYIWSNDSVISHISSASGGQIYSVTITDSTGCSVNKTIDIYQPDILSSSFTNQDTIYLSDNGYAFFLNASTGHDLSVWNFGDGSQADSSENPIHQFVSAGSYVISLAASSESCGEVFSSAVLTVLESNPNVGINDQVDSNPGIYILQNGVDATTVLISFKHRMNANIIIYSSLGQTVYSTRTSQLSTQISLDQPSGIYFLKVSSGENSYMYKIDVL